ncbi:GYF_domain [Hexamita inflata]|uniref:GYF domain n=1 Tax=Hexamita inflata TaxID=28002 RepID=A0AA86N7F1_9EUKA|nr:GYF domain [Hexamita inflata]
MIFIITKNNQYFISPLQTKPNQNAHEKQNNKTLQNEDVEQFYLKTQINEQKPTEQTCSTLNAEEITDQITDKVTTQYDALQTQNDGTHKNQVGQPQDQAQNEAQNNKKDQFKAQNKQNADQKDKSQNQQINLESAQNKSNPKETSDDLNTKENDSEPETAVIRKIKDQIVKVDIQELESVSRQKTEGIIEKPVGSDSWRYVDLNGQIQGPFSAKQMNKWNYKGKLPLNLHVSSGNYSYKLQAKDLLQQNFFRETEQQSKKVLNNLLKVDKHDDINVEDILRQQLQNTHAITTGTTAKTKQNVTKKTQLQIIQAELMNNENYVGNELNPEAENHKTNKPIQNKLEYFGDFQDKNLDIQPGQPQNQNQQEQYNRQENRNTETTLNNQTTNANN